jgi:predicted dehydrogenase
MKEIEVGIIGIEGIAARNHLPSRQNVEGVPS